MAIGRTNASTGGQALLTVTANSGSASAGLTVTASNGDKDYTGVFNSEGVVGITVAPGYDYTITESSGKADLVTLHVDAEGASVELKFIVVTITVTDEKSSSVSGLTVVGTGAASVSAVTNASGIATFMLGAEGSYSFTLDSGSIPSDGKAQRYDVTVSKGEQYNGTIEVLYGFGYTIVAITEGTSDPYNRTSYPASVMINGKTYTNSIPSTGFTEARGTSLNGWADTNNLCSKLIEGIRPVALNGSTWITDGFSLTDSRNWDSSYDWFTEFPFRWMAWYKTGGKVYIIFSDRRENPDSTIFQDYAFLNNSNVRKPNMHIGCFDGTVTSSVLYSKRTGAKPTEQVSISGYINYAKARGTDFDIITFYQVMYIIGLFTTLYKTTDCQGYSNSAYGLGKGRVASTSIGPLNGITFDNNYGMYGDRTSDVSKVSFFWIHDIWGNIRTFVGGAKTDYNGRLMTQTGKVSSVTDSDFNNTALTPSRSDSDGAWITEIAGGQKTGPFPTRGGGSGTTYYSDSYAIDTSSSFPAWGGGRSYDNNNAGLFHFYFSYSASQYNSEFGARLSYKGGRT